MMVGEIRLSVMIQDEAINDSTALSSLTTMLLIVFILLITIVLMNMCVGLAVDDIAGVTKDAEVSQLIRRINFCLGIEYSVLRGDILGWRQHVYRQSLMVNTRELDETDPFLRPPGIFEKLK